MKNKILALLFAVIPGIAAFASPTTVEVQNLTSVLVNGLPAGTVVDVLAQPNAPADIRAKLLDALLAYEGRVISHTEQERAHMADDLAKDTAKAAALLTAKVQVAENENATAKSEADAAKLARAQDQAQLAAVMDALAPINVATLPIPPASKDKLTAALKSDRQKKREAMQAAKAQIDAELAKLATNP